MVNNVPGWVNNLDLRDEAVSCNLRHQKRSTFWATFCISQWLIERLFVRLFKTTAKGSLRPFILSFRSPRWSTTSLFSIITQDLLPFRRVCPAQTNTNPGQREHTLTLSLPFPHGALYHHEIPLTSFSHLSLSLPSSKCPFV